MSRDMDLIFRTTITGIIRAIKQRRPGAFRLGSGAPKRGRVTHLRLPSDLQCQAQEI